MPCITVRNSAGSAKGLTYASEQACKQARTDARTHARAEGNVGVRRRRKKKNAFQNDRKYSKVTKNVFNKNEQKS